MNTLKQTTVRVNLSNDFEVKATLKGLQFGNNVITWNWIENAKKVVFPDVEKKVTATKTTAAKRKVQTKKVSGAKKVAAANSPRAKNC